MLSSAKRLSDSNFVSVTTWFCNLLFAVLHVQAALFYDLQYTAYIEQNLLQFGRKFFRFLLSI